MQRSRNQPDTASTATPEVTSDATDTADDMTFNATDQSPTRQRDARVTMPLAATHVDEEWPKGVLGGAPDDSDPAATVATAAIPSSSPSNTSRPRKNTLAAAIRPRQSDEHPAVRSIPVYHPDSDELPGGFADDLHDLHESARDGIPDETDGEDEWSVADQPTVMLVPQIFTGAAAHQPAAHQPAATERASWPSLRDAQGAAERGAAPRQPKSTRPIQPDVLGGPRYASPDGKLMPETPPEGTPRVAHVSPRVERFQELRGQRKAHEQGELTPQDTPPVKEAVHAWWNDLRPGLGHALHAQHEARASGAYPIPAYVATAVSRLGDAFGKVAVSTRDLAMRAHNTAAPTLRRWHDQAEEYAQRLIDRLEGGPVQQQAPFLGPGRIAVLFRSGVTVGQAQRLLQTARAKPMRLIPRKHGFLALVLRGTEGEVAERLRQHPYVRDVIYMEYDDPSQSLSAEVPAMMGLQR